MARTNNTELRERTIAILKAAGYTNRMIAEALQISASVVSLYDRRYHYNTLYKTDFKRV